MSNEGQVKHAKKPYSKPKFKHKPLAEYGALLREEFMVCGESEGETGLLQGPILLVEGYDGHVAPIREAFARADLSVRAEYLESGEGAIVVGSSGEEGSPLDDSPFLLLDFRVVSQRNGKLVEKIAKHPKLQRAPVAILVHSVEEARRWTPRDSTECWRLQGSPKPEDLARACKSLLQLWTIRPQQEASDTRSCADAPHATQRRNAAVADC